MMRDAGTLMMRAASTYSLRRSTMVSARTVRAYCTQFVSEIERTITMAANGSLSEGGSASRKRALTRIAISSVGIDSTVSPIRMRMLSILPP